MAKARWCRLSAEGRRLADVPYSERMKTRLKDPAAFYKPKVRPSGHDISEGFAKDNGGAIPANLLQIPNTESNGQYLMGCKTVGDTQHPARFPAKLPELFINMLYEPGDLVLDIFAGLNTTGHVAETTIAVGWRSMAISLHRLWLKRDKSKEISKLRQDRTSRLRLLLSFFVRALSPFVTSCMTAT